MGQANQNQIKFRQDIQNRYIASSRIANKVNGKGVHTDY